MKLEQRKYMRYQVRTNAFISIRGEVLKVGRINEISGKGLSFQYLTDNEYTSHFYQQYISSEKIFKADIFTSENGCFVSNIICKISSDIIEKTFIVSRIAQRRCGIQFEILNKKQQIDIEIFIALHSSNALSLNSLEKTT